MKWIRLWLIGVLFSGTAKAALTTNSWTDGSSKWETGGNWSLSVPPSTNGQTTIAITNAGGNVVTIDATTVLSNASNGCLTVTNFTINGNTLALTNAGTVTPLEIIGPVTGFSVRSSGAVIIRNSFLRMRAQNPFMDGSLLLDGGLLIITNSPVVPFLIVGFSAPGSLVVSNGTMVAANLRISSGSFRMAGGTTIVERLFENFGSELINGGTVICTGAPSALRSNSQMTMSNGTVVASRLEVGTSYNQSGTFTLAGGSVEAAGMFLGGTFGSSLLTGTVWIVGASAVLSNGTTTIGSQGGCFPCGGVGRFIVSNGVWRAQDVGVGSVPKSQGTLTLVGGVMTVSSNLTIGECAMDAGTGRVFVAGGSLFVTNALTDALLEVRNGTFTLNSGSVVVDKFVMTNACANFVRTGGTLIYGSALLNPVLDADGDGIPNGYEQSHGLNPLNSIDAASDNDGDGQSNLQEYLAGTDPTVSDFRITAIAREGNDIRITWTTFGGKTNRVLVSSGAAGGAYTNNFSNLSPRILMPGAGVTSTNYLDVGGATNTPARYYRVRQGFETGGARFLFDAGHAQSAGNADWVIDADARNITWNSSGTFTISGNDSNAQRIPTPAASGIVPSTLETNWGGALSAWAVDLVKRGHSVETLPAGATLTYNTANSQDLTNYNVVVVDEPNILFTLTEKQALLSFVTNGGSLFMIADHTSSDRNGDGVDSPVIWMDFLTNNLITNNPFGIVFPSSNSSGINTFNRSIVGDPILNGPLGVATNTAYFSGNKFQIDHTKNPTVTSHMWFGAIGDSNNLCAVASLRCGNGRVVVCGDSSPMEDGTGDPGDTIFNGYTGDVGDTNRMWILNASEWLAAPFQ